ncbi:MAG: reverse transcriptase/maturase family protein [Lachnospiraceae bacterium]|nr:reverse transcriptase/maturase family protein [Lachnospiraceae bacterium]
MKVLIRSLNRKTYSFDTWTVRLQEKEDGSKRPILVPPLTDRIVLKAIAKYVSELFKPEFKEVSDRSFAYQKGRSVRDALIQLKRRYSKGKVILKLDIQKFFNNIDRDLVCSLLEKKIDKSDYILTLIRESLSPRIDFTEIGDEASITDFDRNGIPQGNPVSPILSNLYLYDFDVKMKKENHTMIRYADDMVFVLDSVEEARKLASDISEYLMSSRRLTFHPIESIPDAKSCILSDLKKTRLTFLGVEFDGEKLLPTSSRIDGLMIKVSSILREKQQVGEKLKQLNTALSQWCGYYAFMDITDCKLKNLSSKIIQKAKHSGITITAHIDLVETMHSARKRQRSKIFPRPKIKGDISWLLSY